MIRKSIYTRCSRGLGFALACLAPVCLSSCGDEGESAAAESSEKPATAGSESTENASTTLQASARVTAPKTADSSAKDALFDELLNNISTLVTDNPGLTPAFNEGSKLLLEKLQAYYDELAADPATMERAHLAVRMADITAKLSSYKRARATYEEAQADLDALPESEKQSLKGKRLQSLVWGGLAYCTLQLESPDKALPLYEKILKLDIDIAGNLGVTPAEPSTVLDLSPDQAQAIADVLSSYRCLGDCLSNCDDTEEARDTYQHGLDFLKGIQFTISDPVGMNTAIAIAKLYSSIGDLENKCGQDAKALESWTQAAKLCQHVGNNATQDARSQTQAKLFLNRLITLIKEKQTAIQEAARAQEESAQEEQPAQPETAPAEPAAEPQAAAPAPAPEPAATPARTETPRQNNRRNRRNRR